MHTRFVYLGLQDEVAAEERSSDGSTYTVSKAFTHGSGGEKLALVDSPSGGATKKHFYSVNPHGDVETLTDGTGETTGTYRYTAYGEPDKKGTLGVDAIQDDPVKDADIVNPYRFNSKRFDGATGTYDMGFREYDPGLNRFLTRDMYSGALADMNLGSDPWTVNRYAFAGGNPITGIELDGHEPCDPAVSNCDQLYCGSGGCEGDFAKTADPPSYPNAALNDIPNSDPRKFATVQQELRSLLDEGDDVAYQQTLTAFCYYHVDGLCGDRMSGEEYVNMLGRAAYELSPLSTPEGIADCFAEGDFLTCIGAIPAFKPTKASKLGAKACSFAGETEVLMADGSTKPISKIKVGDEVLATDPETGERRVETVKRVFVHDDTVVDLEIDGHVLATTEDHRFWSVTDAKFERADQLARGELVLAADGRRLRVGGFLPATSRRVAAFNLEISTIHTYHVSAHAILVHNDCGSARGRWASKADFSDARTLSRKYDAHAADFGIVGNRNGANLASFENSMRAHMKNPATKFYRFNHRGQGMAVGFINPSNNRMVMLDASNGKFWTGYRLGDNQFAKIVDEGFLW